MTSLRLQTTPTQRNATTVSIVASLYVLSGICQPLIMTLCKNAGLADPSSQLYMVFYYLGPAALVFTLPFEQHDATASGTTATRLHSQQYPSKKLILRASAIAAFDICAQALNYTGAAAAGPTIFAIVYSSVTVWAAVFSQLLLGRTMSCYQWLSVLTVFIGLAITATDSFFFASTGQRNILHGTALVLVGSVMHALTYVLSEGIMTVGVGTSGERLTIRQNAAMQGVVACGALTLWQLLYTWPRRYDLIVAPAVAAGTTTWLAAAIFGSFLLANFVHSLSFFYTLRHYPGGATSAGVMKGLQAVLVFGAAHVLYCGRIGGLEMCFSSRKLISLCVVVGGVTLFGFATERQSRDNAGGTGAIAGSDGPSLTKRNQGYTRIESQEGVEVV